VFSITLSFSQLGDFMCTNAALRDILKDDGTTNSVNSRYTLLFGCNENCISFSRTSITISNTAVAVEMAEAKSALTLVGASLAPLLQPSILHPPAYRVAENRNGKRSREEIGGGSTSRATTCQVNIR